MQKLATESVLIAGERFVPFGPDPDPLVPLEAGAARPVAAGKFLRLEGHQWFIKGVSYGTFAPDPSGWQFPVDRQVSADFELIARFGFNTVRLYTTPSPWVLEEAVRCGLRLIIGVPWPQHVAFLEDRALCRRGRQRLTSEVRRLAGHPAILLFAIGNEVPASVVRWHGRGRLERFLRELYQVTKDVSPVSLVTYVNYPPTEYLELPFLDVAAFNVYLHRESELRAYLARLHNIAGNRPLLLAEAGADSLREGEAGQATLTAMQLRAAFREGTCGAVAYGWTDEWWRGGQDISDWAFGLVDRERSPKLALHAAARVFASPDRPQRQRSWPKVSVIVCAYNAADTLDDCLTSLECLSYPEVELILVDDGSSDGTAAIANRHPSIKLVQVDNGGLSAARNIGLSHATGEIVAYTDADVRVEPEWLTYLVEPLFSSSYAGSGGPNVVPTDDPWLAQCVARAPGGPSHVLFDDRTAEHVPGCNMAFRRDVLVALDGFNPVFTKAGDDVDFCWRLQARGWKIAFAPSALVWHHHRSSLRAYWNQQLGYGEGEAWLKPLHPEKFVGRRVLWRGHIYSPLPFVRSLRHATINVGVWGSAAFPSVYRFDAHPFAHLPHSLRWQLCGMAFFVLGLALMFSPYLAVGLACLGAGASALGTTFAKCVKYALDTEIDRLPRIAMLPRVVSRFVYRWTVAWLHFLQPFARTHGRILGFLSPPRGVSRVRHEHADPEQLPRSQFWTILRLFAGRSVQAQFWSESWVSSAQLLQEMTDRLRSSRAAHVIEMDDGWGEHRDFSVAAGRWVWLDLRALVEEHNGGQCLIRVATAGRVTRAGRFVTSLVIGTGIALSGAGAVWGLPLGAMAGPIWVAIIGALMVAPIRRTLSAVRAALLGVAAGMGLIPLKNGTVRGKAVDLDEPNSKRWQPSPD
ncbi:MAG: glycosyl transferase [Acidobacteria bacterium]|nr:glycosyl transferase [Acidobacteriota bacterium]